MVLITYALILFSVIVSLQPSLQLALNANEKMENNENREDTLKQLRETLEKRGFTSLGWGPGGLPYADNYYNEFSHENILRKIQQRQLNNKASGDIMIEPLALALSTGKKVADESESTDLLEDYGQPRYEDPERSEEKGMKEAKAKVYMPSLFKSYGWLPAGQK